MLETRKPLIDKTIRLEDYLVDNLIIVNCKRSQVSPREWKPFSLASLFSQRDKEQLAREIKVLKAYIETRYGVGSYIVIPRSYMDSYGVSETSLPDFIKLGDVKAPMWVTAIAAKRRSTPTLLGVKPRN